MTTRALPPLATGQVWQCYKQSYRVKILANRSVTAGGVPVVEARLFNPSGNSDAGWYYQEPHEGNDSGSFQYDGNDPGIFRYYSYCGASGPSHWASLRVLLYPAI